MARQSPSAPLWLLALAASTLPGCSRSVAQSQGLEPGRSVELVVYSDDFALVQESRDIEVTKGTTRIGIQEVSDKIDQGSVVYSWPDTKDAKVRSSTYELGTQDSGRLLQRLLGKEVELVYRADNGREGDRKRGTLQIAEPGNIVVKVGDKLIVNPNATIEAPAETGVVTIPQLSAEVESTSDTRTRLGVSYLTRGLSWAADYTATLTPDSDEMSLECWGTIVNQTGTEFPNAKLTFVAGTPNRAVRNERRYPVTESDLEVTTGAVKRSWTNDATLQTNSRFGAPEMAGELYAYPYKVAATIRPDQMNRVRMMGSDEVKVTRDYAVRLSGFDSYNFYQRPEQRLNATLSLKLKNSKSGGLGLPLPGGAIRFFEPSSSGTLRYIGASSLNDTPTDAAISATLTNVFDIYAKTRLVSTRKVDRRTVARDVQVSVHNEKDKDIQVRLVQDFWGKWKVVKQSHSGKKTNASTQQWTVTVPKKSTVQLSYTVHFG